MRQSTEIDDATMAVQILQQIDSTVAVQITTYMTNSQDTESSARNATANHGSSRNSTTGWMGHRTTIERGVSPVIYVRGPP
jgi:hypothetical protein